MERRRESNGNTIDMGGAVIGTLTHCFYVGLFVYHSQSTHLQIFMLTSFFFRVLDSDIYWHTVVYRMTS